jgi:sialidase-1
MVLRGIIMIGAIIILLVAEGHPQTKASTVWHGFEKLSFTVEGRNAYIVKPMQALPGNPWVWRAYFPEWHIEMDSILLSKGFYIAFIDCNDMYGSPAAMQAWECFYQHLINHYSFAKKAALEGVSRGGLYVYGWAKRNPDKVSCIYGEVPVQEALDFHDNPIDNIEALAAYKVPIIHLVSTSDSLVPLAENTSVFAEKYLLLGGSIQVDTMWDSISAAGHHFIIRDPQHYADFIIQNTLPVKNSLSSANFIELNGKLNNTIGQIKNERKLTVAFLGGSITYNPGWRDKICKFLQETYPQTSFTFIPGGIPSLGSLPHSYRLQTDVLDKGKIDLLFLEAAVNDHANNTDSIIQFRAMEGIIRHALTTNPSMNIVLMAFADEDKNRDFERNIEPLEVKVHRQLAAYYHLPFLNLAKEVYERIADSEFTWKDDFKDLHPSPYGQNIYYQSIKTMFQLADREFRGEHIMAVKIPEPLNTNCYDKGAYVDVHQATKLQGFSIIDKWRPTDQKETRQGFVNVPVLEATNAGSSFTFSFRGNAIGIGIVSGPDAGSIEYRVDNGKTRTLNLFTKWSKSLHLPWYLILADSLQEGKHILEVKTISNKDNSGSNACRIVHFLVNR